MLPITQNQQHKEKSFHKEGKKGSPSLDTFKRRKTQRDELSEFEFVGVLLTYRGLGDSNYAKATWVPKHQKFRFSKSIRNCMSIPKKYVLKLGDMPNLLKKDNLVTRNSRNSAKTDFRVPKIPPRDES